MSGITWAGGSRYYAVSDKLRKVFPLAIELDPASRTIRHAALDAGIPLAGSTDLEGVAYDARTETLLISDEAGPGIRVYRAADGTLVRTLEVPTVFRSARTNLSLESLAIDPDDQSLWSA